MHLCLAVHGLACAHQKMIQVMHISKCFDQKLESCLRELESRLGSWPSIT